MHWARKSAEKPHPWAVDHEPMGPGAMGPVGGRGAWGVGVGGGAMGPGARGPWRRGRVRAGWGCGLGVGVAGARKRTSVGSHAAQKMKNGTRSHGAGGGCVGVGAEKHASHGARSHEGHGRRGKG